MWLHNCIIKSSSLAESEQMECPQSVIFHFRVAQAVAGIKKGNMRFY